MILLLAPVASWMVAIDLPISTMPVSVIVAVALKLLRVKLADFAIRVAAMVPHIVVSARRHTLAAAACAAI